MRVRYNKSTVSISTHAPRTGSDSGHALANPQRSGISTHAPRTGSDKDEDESEGE